MTAHMENRHGLTTETSPAFTPGPWSVYHNVRTNTDYVGIGPNDDGEVVGIAMALAPENARLIAAAPEMYEALKTAFCADDCDGSHRINVELARAALAKAEGR